MNSIQFARHCGPLCIADAQPCLVEPSAAAYSRVHCFATATHTQRHTHTGAHTHTCTAHAIAVRELLTSSFCSSLAPALCALLFVLLSAIAALLPLLLLLLPPSGLLAAPTVTPLPRSLLSQRVQFANSFFVFVFRAAI